MLDVGVVVIDRFLVILRTVDVLSIAVAVCVAVLLMIVVVILVAIVTLDLVFILHVVVDTKSSNLRSRRCFHMSLSVPAV